MNGDRDDEALRWEGDTEPAYLPVAPARAAATASESFGLTPTQSESTRSTVAKAGTGSFLLVSYGIIAGAYLIYTIGWIAPIVTHERPSNPDLLGEFMVRLAQVLAIGAPAIWYGATLLLTRGRRPIVRLLCLLGGLVVLLPWPYLLLGV